MEGGSDNADNNADNHMGDISADECRNDLTRNHEFAYVCLKDYDNQKGTRPKKFLGKFSGLLKLLTREVNDMLYLMENFRRFVNEEDKIQPRIPGRLKKSTQNIRQALLALEEFKKAYPRLLAKVNEDELIKRLAAMAPSVPVDEELGILLWRPEHLYKILEDMA